ncbi:MAG: hypothetical protein ACOC2T_00220 [Planctomycetota bacterium]
MDISVFEAMMLVCFGGAWPFSIYESWHSQSNEGKSVVFLVVIFTGYVCGVVHKINHDWDPVVLLYTLNGLMVLTDIVLYWRNSRPGRSEEVCTDNRSPITDHR